MGEKLAKLREAYKAAVTEFQSAAKAIEDAPDDITTEDLQTLEATLDTTEKTVDDAKHAVELFERTQKAREITIPDTLKKGDVKVDKEPLTYQRRGPNSVFHDLAAVELRGDQKAAARLEAHRNEMRIEQPERFDLSSTDAAGGFLVPPIFLQEEFADLARAGRVVVDTLGARALPPNTDTINVPKLSTGVTVADQADNAAVSETDAVFASVAAAVKTIAGMQDVSQQLIDRSIPGVDEVIFADLVKAYSVDLDTKVIKSTVTDNKGILDATGINTVTYTDASPTVAELYPKLADAIQKIHTGIFMSPDAIFMHPRRWAWILAGTDTSNRPLVTPYAPQNSAGSHGGVVAQGLVGSIQGVPVYVDANIPTTLGTGTDEDRIIVVRRDELYVWEDQSGPYLETFRDVGSGTLTVRFRLHGYWAQMHERRAKAITAISGTGLIAPTF